MTEHTAENDAPVSCNWPRCNSPRIGKCFAWCKCRCHDARAKRSWAEKHYAEAEAPTWLTEWAVEVTWRDWQKAGAKGPTSQFGPFDTPESRDAFLEMQRRDRDIAATRVLSRRAAYTPWVGPETPDPTTEEEREALLERLYAELFPRVLPPEAPATSERGERQ